jgi:hypothetical protein
VADRIAFWARLHDRITILSNRIDPEAQAKIIGDIHARVPMPTPEEQRALHPAALAILRKYGEGT